MQDKEKELSKYRLSLANETLANAKMCLDNQFFRDCINRSYYAVAYFNKKYVAADIFPKELGKRLGRIKMIREESDYSDFFVVSSEDAEKQYKTAIFILENVQAYLKEQNILD